MQITKFMISVSRRIPTPPRVKKLDTPRIGIFHAADSGISSDEQIPVASSVGTNALAFNNHYAHGVENRNLPISSSLVSGLLTKIRDAQIRNQSNRNIVHTSDPTFYSDDEDDPNLLTSTSAKAPSIAIKNTSKPKAFMVKLSKTIFSVICLPFLLICDLISTSLQWAFSLFTKFKTSTKWKYPSNMWIHFKQYQFTVFQPPKSKKLLNLVLVILLLSILLFTALYIWRGYVTSNLLQDVLLTSNVKISTGLTTIWSSLTSVVECMAGFFVHLGLFFGSQNVLKHQDTTNRVYLNSEDLQSEMETMINNILANEKFDNRIKEEFKKMEDTRREGILAKINEQEALLTSLINEYKEKAGIRQMENRDDLETSKNEVEKNIGLVTDKFPSITTQIGSIELSIKDEEIKGAQRYETLDQGLQEMREQLAQLKLRQANNSNSHGQRETDVLSKLEDFESRLNHLVSVQSKLSQTITECSKSKNVDSLDVTANEKLLNERISQVLKDLFDKNTTNESSDSKPLSKAREYVSKLNAMPIDQQDILTKDQFQLQIEEASKTWKREVVKEMQNEFSQSLVAGGSTDKVLRETVENELNNILASRKKSYFNENISGKETVQFSEEEVSRIIKSELVTYDADKTGKFDFALESAGGTIVSTRCTQTYDASTAVYSVWGIPIWWESVNGPRAILQPGANPGQCWAVKGDGSGLSAPPISVVVRLSDHVKVDSVTLEHIPETLSPDGNIKSAPKEFSVLGLYDINDPNPVLLGNFTYIIGNRPVQTFQIPPKESKDLEMVDKNNFPLVELKIHSNYGNPTYTCVYRFRVHGNPNTEAKTNFR